MSSNHLRERDAELTLQICTLLDTVRAMHEARTATGLRDLLSGHVFAFLRELIPANYGGVFLDDQGSGHPSERGMLERVGRVRGAIHEVAGDGWVLAVPLLVRQETAGLIYLNSGSVDRPFSETQLLLLTAIAQIASSALENAYQVEWLEGEVRRLTRTADADDQMVGVSQRLADLRERIARLGPASTTVLILGESGTGKELVARSLHRRSSRSDHAFVVINCAALTESLLESELFGHERGAFTGAVTQKPGKLEMAEGGTVFLDEIGEMPLSLQAKLLRVLQHREFERVGGLRTIPLNIRLIAATNQNLEDAVRRGSFREDLFYRLNVVTLRTPPLRERPEDILPLATHFAIRFGKSNGRPITGISPQARSVLRGHEWPGNVRELENAIEHAVVLGSGDTVLAEDLPDGIRDRWHETSPHESGMLNRSINAAKRSAVKRAFEIAGQDHADAARLLGVHPNYLYRLLHNLNLQPLVKAMASE